jgi:DNA-binding GntR family transcriptional regulator
MPQETTKQPLAVSAYQLIYRNIMTLKFEPGQRLEEKQLMEQLGIGRTPIREALMHLSADFMVESQHNKGFIVRPITLQNTKAAFAALKILELGVAELAVRQDPGNLVDDMKAANEEVISAIREEDVVAMVEANSEFHNAFARTSRNDYLIQSLHQVRCETNRLAYLSFNNEVDPLRSLPEHYESVIAHHDGIIDAIARREEEPLKRTLSEHIQAFQNRILLFMAS